MSVQIKWCKLVFILSILWNIFTCLDSSVQPTYELGVLLRDVAVTADGNKVAFTLPRGLTVANASPRGIAAADLFSPSCFTRFTIIVAGSDSDFIDYSAAKTRMEGAVYQWFPGATSAHK